MTRSSALVIRKGPSEREEENPEKIIALLNRDLMLNSLQEEENPLRDIKAVQKFLRRADEVGGRISDPQASGPDMIRYGRVNPFRAILITISGVLMFYALQIMHSWIKIERVY